MKKIHTLFFYFKLICNTNFFYLLCNVVLAIIKWFHSIANILLVKRILDSLEKGLINESLFYAVIMVVLFLIISIVKEIVTTKQIIARKNINTKLQKKLGEHYVSLPYYITHQHDKQEAYEMAKKCVDKSYAEMFVTNTLNILFGVLTIASITYLVKDFPIWFYIILFIVLVVDIIVYFRQANLLYANYIDETPIERGLYYSRGHLMRPEYAKEIRLYQLNDFITKKTEKSINDFYKLSEKTRKLEMRKIFWTYLAEILQYIGIYAIAIIEYYQNTAMTIGSFSLILTSMTSFSQNIRSISANGVSIYKNMKYIEMFESFMKIKKPSCKNAEYISPYERHHFSFEHVTFRYDGMKEDSLKNISIDFYSDEIISVVGESGAGKTTFVLLLLGFIRPTSGRILVDGTSIESLSKNEYMKLFSPVFQDYSIYNMSIIDNIRLSLDFRSSLFSKVTDGIKLDISKFSNDGATIIGNIYDSNGVDLSGGESQKVALARALYKESAMLILDEPTSALDPRSEFHLYKNFKNIIENRGCIFISHRLASCRLCEKIFVFHDGELVENGSHNDLIQLKGHYYSLFNAQTKKYFSEYGEQ